jgi:hypothetical protein
MKSESRSIGAAFTWPHLVLVVKSFSNDGKTEKGFGDVRRPVQLVSIPLQKKL